MPDEKEITYGDESFYGGGGGNAEETHVKENYNSPDEWLKSGKVHDIYLGEYDDGEPPSGKEYVEHGIQTVDPFADYDDSLAESETLEDIGYGNQNITMPDNDYDEWGSRGISTRDSRAHEPHFRLAKKIGFLQRKQRQELRVLRRQESGLMRQVRILKKKMIRPKPEEKCKRDKSRARLPGLQATYRQLLSSLQQIEADIVTASRLPTGESSTREIRLNRLEQFRRETEHGIDAIRQEVIDLNKVIFIDPTEFDLSKDSRTPSITQKLGFLLQQLNKCRGRMRRLQSFQKNDVLKDLKESVATVIREVMDVLPADHGAIIGDVCFKELDLSLELSELYTTTEFILHTVVAKIDDLIKLGDLNLGKTYKIDRKNMRTYEFDSGIKVQRRELQDCEKQITEVIAALQANIKMKLLWASSEEENTVLGRPNLKCLKKPRRKNRRPEDITTDSFNATE